MRKYLLGLLLVGSISVSGCGYTDIAGTDDEEKIRIQKAEYTCIWGWVYYSPNHLTRIPYANVQVDIKIKSSFNGNIIFNGSAITDSQGYFELLTSRGSSGDTVIFSALGKTVKKVIDWGSTNGHCGLYDGNYRASATIVINTDTRIE